MNNYLMSILSLSKNSKPLYNHKSNYQLCFVQRDPQSLRVKKKTGVLRI